MFRGIRFKLSFVSFILILFVSAASSFIVVSIMDDALLDELVKRGFSISRSAATAAGFSMLSEDSLALDNLSSKLKEYQKDIVYVSTVDENGKIIAHSQLGKAGENFRYVEGDKVGKDEDGATVRRVRRMGTYSYEFKTPIIFAGSELGFVYVGISEDTLLFSQRSARKKIFLISGAILSLGVAGVFFLSGFITTPVKRLREGVLNLEKGEYRGEIKVVSKDELGELTKNFNKMATVITDQKGRMEHYAAELEEAYVSTVRVLAAAIDARDEYTLGHSERVARLSVLTGKKLGLADEELKDLELACLFHDVGKIKTPDSILHKKERLDKSEFDVMSRHAQDGARILGLARSLHKHVPVVLYHHEWYNGEGYPRGLKKEEIPLFASIIAIADAFDAMTSSRPYRRGMSEGEATREILRFRGLQFSPEVTDVFLDVMKDYIDDVGLKRSGVRV